MSFDLVSVMVIICGLCVLVKFLCFWVCRNCLLSELGFSLSEPGFSGFQDFQDKRRGVGGVYVYTCIRVFFLNRDFQDWRKSLNQDFQDYRIFRIREEGVGVYVYGCIRVDTCRSNGAFIISMHVLLYTCRTSGAKEVAMQRSYRKGEKRVLFQTGAIRRKQMSREKAEECLVSIPNWCD